MHLQSLFTEIFNSDLNDPGSDVLLQDLINKNPYFAAPSFFLLKKTAEGAAGYNSLAARTALHFDNPFLLNYRLKMNDEHSQYPETLSNEINKSTSTIDTGTPVVTPGVENKNNISDEINSPESLNETKDLQTENNSLDTVEAVVNTGDKSLKVEEEIKETAPLNEEPMIFEPLFATDYFASQGIKLSEEVHAGDKLGRQLKSFTEWLKSMKKVHEEKTVLGGDQTDMTVQTLAEKSNQEDDVITESMADAYLQQGKNKKAIEIFRKLSLLNPAKSAYFAAKIEQAGS